MPLNLFAYMNKIDLSICPILLITKQTQRTRSRHMSAHLMARFAPFILTMFYCNVWRTKRFDNLTVKGFNLHWCKSNVRKPAEQNLFSISSSNL